MNQSSPHHLRLPRLSNPPPPPESSARHRFRTQYSKRTTPNLTSKDAKSFILTSMLSYRILRLRAARILIRVSMRDAGSAAFPQVPRRFWVGLPIPPVAEPN